MFDRNSMSLAGRKGLITGIANDQSIAWGCAKAFRFLGADLAVGSRTRRDRSDSWEEPIGGQTLRGIARL